MAIERTPTTSIQPVKVARIRDVDGTVYRITATRIPSPERLAVAGSVRRAGVGFLDKLKAVVEDLTYSPRFWVAVLLAEIAFGLLIGR